MLGTSTLSGPVGLLSLLVAFDLVTGMLFK